MKRVLFLGPRYHRTHQPSQSDRSHTDIEKEDEEEEEDVRGAPREKALKKKPRKLFKEKEKGMCRGANSSPFGEIRRF